MDWLKGMLKEPTTWAGLGLIVAALGKGFALGEWTLATEMITSGFWLIVLRGRGAAKIVPCLALVMLPGCSLLTPGLDTREALKAMQTTEYRSDGSFSSTEDTTHERRNVVAEGEKVAVDFYQDGTPKAVKDATNVLTQSSAPKDAAAAKMALDALNAQVALEGIKAAREAVTLMQTMRAAEAAAGTANNAMDLFSRLRPEDQAWVLGMIRARTQPAR